MIDDYQWVQFLPHRGELYEDGIQGRKVLILGESHHHDCDKKGNPCIGLTKSERDARHRELTREVVRFWKDHPAKTPLSHRLPALFGIERFGFWDRVSFYNYVQSFVSAPRQRPSEKAFLDDNSVKAFQEVLDRLLPDRILVLGKKTWISLPGNSPLGNSPPGDSPQFARPPKKPRPPKPEPRVKPSEKFRNHRSDGVACWYFCHSGHFALALPIYHPTMPGFRVQDWVDSVRNWLRFTGLPGDDTPRLQP